MVRCSIKRTIKTTIFLVISIIIFQTFTSSSKQSNVEPLKVSRKSLLIVIISINHSHTFPRLVLFLNELRLPYLQYRKTDGNVYHYLAQHIPSLIVIDQKPDKKFYAFVKQHHIPLLIILNNQCPDCLSIPYSQMLFENMTYPSMDFHREDLKPIVHTTATPFQIEQSNEVIKILRFESSLPFFQHHYQKDISQCVGLRTSDEHSLSSVIYVKSKLTSERISLVIVSSDRQIYLSECLYHHWFIWPLIMDILRYLTLNEYDYHGFNRSIQIDIDDIFLGGKSNDYLRSNDIHALLRSQLFIGKYIRNFRFRLGFSGYYYNLGSDKENEGNRLLMEEKDEFIWFHHTWKHEKLTNITDKIALISSTKTNLDFAQRHKLPIDRNYAVAPHHSGIYPINPVIYDIWHGIFNFNVTSTENYPYHYALSSTHRGYVYRGVSVLPRQACGLYTTTRSYSNYPNGSGRLEQYLMGGKLFRMILTNPMTIFMSHNVNYGRDRLANYVFSKLVYLISTWTRIVFTTDQSTSELARKYFHDYYPDEQVPIFTNPCDDRGLMNLWNGNRSLCQIFPQLLIVGPQKTGTTALHSMLSQHPDLHPSKTNSRTYEEIQFFSNDTIYLQGINWYLNQFSSDSVVSERSLNFEKSATYFDSLVAVERIKGLLLHVRLIVILIEPGARAHSRYQHEVARTNLTLSFDQLLHSNHNDDSNRSHLKQRCLQPGHYAEHLQRWLAYFPSKQIYIIDGDSFRRDPSATLNDIQISFLQLNNPINSSKLVRFNKKKGFYCPISNDKRFQCLGNSKGRRTIFNRIELTKRCVSHSPIFHASEGRIGYPSERYEPTTIAALDKDSKRLPLITGLYEDGFMIGGQDRIVGAIFQFPRQVVCWNVFSPDQITPESLALLQLIQPRPEIFVLGIGARTNKIPPETIQFIRSLRIGFEILPTTQACETFNFLLTDNRLVYAGFFPQNDLVDQNYGLRKAIAHSQLYEKDEEYLRTDMLKDTYDVMIKAHRERKLLSPYSPLNSRQVAGRQNDDTHIHSLTGTSNTEKRPPVKKQDEAGTDNQTK